VIKRKEAISFTTVYGFIARMVEASFVRQVVGARRASARPSDSALYQRLSAHLTELLGLGTRRPSAHTAPTRDDKGIVFASHDGDVYPAGFLPLGLGSIRAGTALTPSLPSFPGASRQLRTLRQSNVAPAPP
jgi:hypothetical protein